ncbi:partner of Y14 and mago-like [Teleopsis dalmanni]|uniref:partner of Y14 and mago-like n=1 Tax=Teleopsis dalmanni TaxID=139649 RepID=UPI0018CFA215|nr:partner of Y14 and mago-like [Teleopsis dalmanni]XP_037940010.1 partner of Y14 and mago-like [Teleopsis dalmanni]
MTTYSTDSDGKFIPATQRPDGTWRKARRVKQGYVPQEEVPLYESKGKQFAQNKITLPPGMCPFAVEAAKKDREKKERAKAKQLEKQANGIASTSKNKQQTPGLLVLPASKSTNQQQSSSTIKTKEVNTPNVNNLCETVETALTLEEETLTLAKTLKKLRKKLREIEATEEKIKSGALKKPDKDQLDKIKKKKDVIKQIKELELEEQQQQTQSSGNQ